MAQPHILANGPPCGPVALFLGSSSGQTRPRGTAPERFSCIFTNESAVWVRAKYRASADRRTDLRLDVAPFLAASRRRTWTRVVHATSFFPEVKLVSSSVKIRDDHPPCERDERRCGG